MKQIFWDVILKGELIDSVPYTEDCSEDYVRRSLIEHDGYDENIEIKNPNKKPKYHTIIFLHDYNDETVAQLLHCMTHMCDSCPTAEDNKHGDCLYYDMLATTALAEYLSAWDQGEYHDEPREQPWGNSDETKKVTVENAGEYILSWNRGLGYVALQIESDASRQGE